MRTGFIVLILLIAFVSATMLEELSDSLRLAAAKRIVNSLHASALADSKSLDGCTSCLDACDSVDDDKRRERCEWGCPCDHSMSEDDLIQESFSDVYQALQPWERECLLCFKPCRNSRDFSRCIGERNCPASCLQLIGRELPEEEDSALESLFYD